MNDETREESLINSIKFMINDLNSRLMETNDFTAVYKKVCLNYGDVIRLCYKLGSIPGDKVIDLILSKKFEIIKRIH